MSTEIALAITLVAVAWLAPWLLIAVGLLRSRTPAHEEERNHDWSLVIFSTLLCVIAFNLTFLIQELSLVLPKSLVPGLRPVLYHNDHSWSGKAPVAELFECAGAVAILISAIAFGAVGHLARQSWLRLFALWMTFEGLFQGLPQFVLGAILPSNDVGRAYAYLHASTAMRTIIALVALAAIPCAGMWIGRSLLLRSCHDPRIAEWRAKARLLSQSLGLPAIAAVPLIIPFRIPREAVEVVLLPMLVQLMGAGWVLAGAWMEVPSSVGRMPESRPIWLAAIIALALLVFFQVVLRPGIRFY